MSGFHNNQPPPTGPQNEMFMEPGQQAPQHPVGDDSQASHFPPPPAGPPPPNINIIGADPSASNTSETAYQPAYQPTMYSSIPEESGPPLPTRPARGVAQSTFQPPQQDLTPKTCPRCSYNNHTSMTNCEMCEAPLQSASGYPATSFPPPPPQHPSATGGYENSAFPPPPHHPSQGFGHGPNVTGFAPPPQRINQAFGADDPSDPLHYTRDPHKLIAYIIPLPIPVLKTAPAGGIPHRFLIYTPPAPPLKKPVLQAGQKEDKVQMAQRKWQEQVRKAKTSNEKVTSFKGLHHRMVKTANKGMGLTTSANLDFLGRVSPNKSPAGSRATTPERLHADDGVQEGHETEKTVPVDEMIFVYPASMGTDEAALREEFINTMMRTKSKAQKDAVIATGLIPVGFGIDFMLVVVEGLGEIATVWAFKSAMGAKNARSITKRLASASNTGDHENDKLRLSFKPSPRLEILKSYINAECNRSDSALFPGYYTPPTESAVLDAIGWSPHQTGGETTNWEDEQWEISEVKEDFKMTMHKGAKEWKKWCVKYEKDWIKEQEQQAKLQQQPQK